MSSVLSNIIAYVSLVSKQLSYVETTDTHYVYELKGFLLPKTIIDKNSKKVLKERTTTIRLDINQQAIGMYDYSVENFGYGLRFKLPIANIPYTLDLNDVISVTGTFQK